MPYFEFRNDAAVQLHRYGNHRQSIVASAAAAENFVTGILELMLWEEGVTVQQAASILGARDGVSMRTRRELQTRLGGSWDH